MKSLGEKIRYYRNLKGWSQEEFSYKLNMSLPAVSKIERNVTDLPFSRLMQISKTLNVTITELVSDNTTVDLKTKIAELEKEISTLQKKLIKCLEK